MEIDNAHNERRLSQARGLTRAAKRLIFPMKDRYFRDTPSVQVQARILVMSFMPHFLEPFFLLLRTIWVTAKIPTAIKATQKITIRMFTYIL